MGKHKHSLKTHHLYLGAGGVIAVVALVVALTFGLSSAQTACSSGNHWDSISNSCMPDMPAGGTYMPPPSGCTSPPAGCPSGQWWDFGMCMCKSSDSGTMPPPTGGCTAPLAGCGSGSTWNQSMCMCQGGTYTPPPSTCIQPATSCPTGSTWNQSTCTCQGGTNMPPPSGGLNCTGGQFPCYSENVCKPTGSSCNDSGMGGGQYPMPGGCTTSMPTTMCGSGQHYECQNNAWTCKTDQYYSGSMPDCAAGQMPTATLPCKMPPPPSCPQGQWYSYSTSSCTSSTMPPPVNTVQCTSPMQPFPGPNGQSACYDPATLPTCSSTVTSACKPQGWVAPTNTTMPTTQGDCWNSSSPNFASQECTQMRAQVNDAKTTQPPNQWQQPQEPQYFQQGQCPQDMLSCDDSWMPGNKVCKTKKFFQWDPQTQKSTEKAMTCESWAAQEKADQEKWSQQGTGMGMGMGGMGMGGMGTGGMGMGMGMMSGQGMQQGQWFDMKGKDQGRMNPCEMNPNDPFCKAGFDFSQMQNQYKFDESQFMPQEGQQQWDKNKTKGEIKGLKNDAKNNWKRDLKQIQQQLKEISRESSGFACPTAVEVSAIAQQYEDAINQVNALGDNASQEEVQKVMALRDFVSGRWENGEQVVAGLQQKLFGGPPDENGQRTPGKMESLNGCRELSNIIRDACTMAKDIAREAARVKKSGAPEKVTKIFDEVVAGLNLRCTNPLAALPAGVSMDELFKPFMPDPEICGEFMYGPGPGGPGGGGQGGGGQGPMPMQFEQMMNQGGQGGFGGMEGLDPSMMEIMKKKFMEMQKGEGNFQGFNPFGASVLSAQAFGDEDFGGEFGPPEDMQGFREPPEECMPPVQRYLSPHRLMRKLEETRGIMDKQFEEMNVCNMLKMATDFIESGEGQGPNGPPPEVISLVKSGTWQKACDSGDTETLAKIKAKLMRLGPPGGGPGPKGKSKDGFGGMIDIDKLVEDKLNEKLASLMGLVEGEETDKTTTAQMKVLEQRIADLQSKLDDAAKTILALNERLSEMTTKLAAVVDLNDSATRAVNSIAKLPDETVQTRVTRSISTLTDKVDEAKQVLPPEADKLVDAMFNAVLTSPPSSQVVEQIAGNLNTIISYAQSGVKKTELVEKVKDQLAEVAVLNGADVGNKVTEGIVAAKDMADLSHWCAVPALQAKGDGFIAKELTEIKPAEPETKCAALTRVARVMEKATGEEIDMTDKTLDRPVPGAPDWCLPFIAHFQEQNVPFVENLRDPNATIDRAGIAVLIHQAIGDRLPDPPSISDYLTPDIKDLPVDQQAAIAEVRYNRIMDATDGTNFSPRVDFNRCQNALVSVKAYEAMNAAEENRE